MLNKRLGLSTYDTTFWEQSGLLEFYPILKWTNVNEVTSYKAWKSLSRHRIRNRPAWGYLHKMPMNDGFSGFKLHWLDGVCGVAAIRQFLPQQRDLAVERWVKFHDVRVVLPLPFWKKCFSD